MILKGISYKNNLPIEVTIAEKQIGSIQSSHPENNLLVGPGFTDIQVNGYSGIDYNDVQENTLDLAKITQSLFKAGVTSHLPTIITNSSNQISKLIKQVVGVREKDHFAKQNIIGLHIEGPFISPLDGPRGAHPKEFVRPPDWNLIQQWQEDAEGLIRLITLSPEWENSNYVIEQCVKNNIHMAIGHTNATHQQLLDAASAGATLSTHLGNGMHSTIARHPNYLWSQLADERLSASIIADGYHLPPEVISVFKKVKNEKLILVSDSVSLAGMPPGNYDLHIGGQVTLTPEGKLHLRNNPSIFAGSASNILHGVSFLIRNKLATVNEAWDMASVRPQGILEPNKPVFEVGATADIVVMKKIKDGFLQLVKTFKAGAVVYSA